MRMGLWGKGYFALLGVLAVSFPGIGRAQAQLPPPEAQKLMQSCDAHKFETIVQVTEDGQTRDSKVKVCGTQGQSDASWIRTLKDAVEKTAANEEMPPAMRQQLISALTVEIARLTALPRSRAPAAAKLPPPRPALSGSDLSSDYSSLPPLPAPVTAPPTADVAPVGTTAASVAAVTAPERGVTAPPLPPPRPAPAVSDLSSDYSSLPPLPAPVAASVAAISAPPPRVRINCMAVRDISLAEPCFMIERDNMLAVDAEEAMDGLLLKFFRRGEPRGEVEVTSLRPGHPVIVNLPSSLCVGVAQTKIEIRASRGSGSSEATFGPYSLRC